MRVRADRVSTKVNSARTEGADISASARSRIMDAAGHRASVLTGANRAMAGPGLLAFAPPAVRLTRQRLGAQTNETIHTAARIGVASPTGKLPFLDRIQRSFGEHDLSGIQAHMGQEATRSARAMDARAYATGEHVVFNGTPDLRTASHEAAHVIQQRAGVHLSGGVGHVGDPYERQADAVADRVMAGQSAEDLLGRGAERGGVRSAAVQRANLILSHVYEHSESPLKTAVNFIAYQTGMDKDSVADQLMFPTDQKYVTALRSDEANYRPVMVKAYIAQPSGSQGRAGADSTMQTAIGKLGNVEDKLRGRAKRTYNGGHLLGYGWFKAWPEINTAKNIAPQDKVENQGGMFGNEGAWGVQESTGRSLFPVIVTAYVNYGSKNYVVSLYQMANELLDPNGPAAKAVRDMRLTWLRFVTVDTRVPTQYVLTLTPPQGVAGGAFASGQNKYAKHKLEGLRAGAALWIPTLRDAILRWLGESVIVASNSGSGVISPNNQTEYPEAIGEALRVAQPLVYYLMYAYGYSLVSATAVVVHGLPYLLGQGAISGRLQSWHPARTPNFESAVNIGESLVRRATAEGIVAMAKTAATEGTNFGYNLWSAKKSLLG
jgi:hypothetical protein